MQELLLARQAGVVGQVLAGVDPAGWVAQAALCAGHPELWAAFGLHPWTAAHGTVADNRQALALLAAALEGSLGVRPVALGELGLDRSRQVPPDSGPQQEQAFREQLAMAREQDLPLVLHIVRAHGRALELLRADGLPAAGGMIHSASTPVEMVPSFLGLGLHLSFGGSVTWNDKARAAAAAVPLDRLLVETDAPDQPLSGRQAPNRPRYLPDVVAALAALHGCSAAALGERTEANARRLLRLDHLGRNC